MRTFHKCFDKTGLCAVALALCAASCAASHFASGFSESTLRLKPLKSVPLKVMSFNIRYGTATDGENHWDNRREMVRETIAVFAPDLLGVQESLKFQCEFLLEQFPEYEFFGRGREVEEDSGEFSAIYFRRDRFEKIGGGHFWLSESPDVAGSSSWDAALPRMVTWVRLNDLQTNSELVFANTHFDHRGVEARAKSAEVIRERLLKGSELPFVLTGDFNTAPGSEPYNTLTGDGSDEQRQLVDTYRVIHPDDDTDGGTFGAWTGKRDGPRIDWILHTPEFTTLNATINYHNDSGRYPSDHYPVEAVIRVKP